jgi:glyoxylate reductase
LKIYSTHSLVGPAWDELDAEVGPLAEAPQDAEVLIVANVAVDLDRFPRLRLIANYGVGYDRIDVDAATQRGVAVTNTPGVLTDATADLAFALILAVRRRLTEGERLVRAGGWDWPWHQGSLGDEVAGSTLGIVGLGRIGAAVARRAQGFDMQVVAVRSRDTSDALDSLLRTADVVTLHVPSTQETRGLIDARRLALMRDGTALINTARGEIVDEDALVRELVSGRLQAGLDVFAHEPNVPQELLGLDNVVLTPHLGSATVRTREAMTRLVVDNVLAFERGEPLPTRVG